MIISALLIISWILTCFPVLNRELFSYNSNEIGINIYGNSNFFDNEVLVYPGDNGLGQIDVYDNEDLAVIEIVPDRLVVPQIGDYLIITMTAKNTGQVAYPAGSFSINLGSLLAANQEGFEGTNPESSNFSIYDRTAFYIDGITHTYYVPLGQNRYYSHHYIPGKPVLKKEIRSIEIEIPRIEGVGINISKITAAKRAFIPVDSHINYFLRSSLNIKNINRYFTPAYILILVLLIIFAFYALLAHPGKNQGDSPLLFKGDCPLLFKYSKKGLVIVILLIPLATVFYFMAANTLFTVKSYWDSYKKYIIEGRLDEAYYGFYDFEKFIAWVDKNTAPKQNIAVLVRGEPVYIMAEMAYNLYPRDIKFIDISGKTAAEIEEELKKLSKEEGISRKYTYLVILSAEDKMDFENIQFLSSYRETGGLLYRLK